MKVMVNTRLLLSGKLTGIGLFSQEVLRRMCAAHPQVKFIFLFDRPYDETFVFGDNVTPVVIGPPARHPMLWYIWFEFAVSKAIKKYKPDVFFSPDGYLSLRSDIPQIPVIHDLNFEHNPERLPFVTVQYLRHYFPLFARKASRIITVSEFSKEDIAHTYKISPKIIDVAYNGVGEAFFPISSEDKAEVRRSFSQNKPYFLFVGALSPRKNILGLLKSFELFKKTDETGHKLVVVGEKMFGTAAMKRFYGQMEYGEDVLFIGRQEEKDLNHLYNAATALWFVSHFEGFGIPIIEAFRAGTAVLTANTSSMPEIGGDAVLYADPQNLEEIVAQMTCLSQDSALRLDLIEKGKKRAEVFTWEKAAAVCWKAISGG